METSSLNPLRQQISDRLALAESLRARRRIFQFSIIQVAALFLLVAGIFLFAKESSETGFVSYLSLIVSDTSTVFSHFGDFVSLLLESMPIESLVLIVAGLAGCFIAWRGLSNLRRAKPLNLWYGFW